MQKLLSSGIEFSESISNSSFFPSQNDEHHEQANYNNEHQTADEEKSFETSLFHYLLFWLSSWFFLADIVTN